MWLQRLFYKYKLEDIFTPSTAANINYVRRQKLEENILSCLDTPGKQIILYGPSGSGKTTLFMRVLSNRGINYIRTHCDNNTSFDSLLLRAFDQLNPYYLSGKSTSRSSTITANVKSEFNSLSSKIENSNTITEGESFTRMLPPQLTTQKLAQFMGAANVIWVIEDFHKVADAEKKKIADALKIFIDEANIFKSVKILCIGTVDSARKLIAYDTNLKDRVAEIQVPLLSDPEITKVIINGCDLLNIKLSDELIKKLVFYSNNICSIAHQLSYDICRKQNIGKTKWITRKVDDNNFAYAMESYITNNSDNLKHIYDTQVRVKPGWYVLKTIVSKGRNGASFDEIRKRISTRRHHFEDSVIIGKINDLIAPEINMIRKNEDSGRYFISTPFWEAFLRAQLELEKINANKSRKGVKSVNLLENEDGIDTTLLRICMDIQNKDNS